MTVPTILLVEDLRQDEILTKRALGKARIASQIDVVRDGAEALEYLFHPARRLPDLVMLDLKLPKVGGLEVLRSLRSHPRTAHMPVVIFTSSSEEDDIRASYAAGANAYVRKPVAATELFEAVRLLGGFWVLINQPPPGVAAA